MKTVNLIGKILNFSILTLTILGVGLFGLGHVTHVHADVGDVFILAMFLVNISWVINAARCYTQSDKTGVKLPKMIQILNAFALGGYLSFVILFLIDSLMDSYQSWTDDAAPYFAIAACVLMVADWIVCSLYLSKYVKEESFTLNKRSAAWIGGVVLVLLSGWGVYAIIDYNKPISRWMVNENVEHRLYRHWKRTLVDKSTNTTILEGFSRIVESDGKDSIAVFFKEGKRGYINLNNGEIIVPATTYTHAWVFSEGLAAVEKDGKIGFINPQGEVVIDFLYEYDKSTLNAFAFRHGRCLMSGDNKKGLIDQQGNWAILPEYDYVCLTSDYVVVGRKGELRKMLDFDGHVLQENIFDSSHELKYERHSLYEEGYERTEYVYVKGICVYRVDGLEGLMTDDARIITLPLYKSIRAYDDNHFKATLLDYSEVWLNRKGEIINSCN